MSYDGPGPSQFTSNECSSEASLEEGRCQRRRKASVPSGPLPFPPANPKPKPTRPPTCRSSRGGCRRSRSHGGICRRWGCLGTARCRPGARSPLRPPRPDAGERCPAARHESGLRLPRPLRCALPYPSSPLLSSHLDLLTGPCGPTRLPPLGLCTVLCPPPAVPRGLLHPETFPDH